MAILCLSLGIICGVLNLLILSHFAKAVTSVQCKISVPLLLTVIFFPLVSLVTCVFIFKTYIYLVGIGMVVALVAGAIIKFIPHCRKKQ